MKRAVSVSLGSHVRDKKVIINLKGEQISVERIGNDGDAEKTRRMFTELDGQVDALGVGGVDIYLRLGGREYPLHAALKLIQDVHRTPVVDGRGLKHTLERRVFDLAAPELDGTLHFQRAFVPVAVDRLGLAEAVSEVAGEVVIGDLMIALGIPVPIYGIDSYRRIAHVLFPIVSYFPMSLLFYGSGGEPTRPKYQRYYTDADLIAGDFLFMHKHLPDDLTGKTVITNTTTEENIEFLRGRGVRQVITTTPRYDGRSFGTNMMEAALTAYAGKGRPLTDDELNGLIDELDLRPSVQQLN
ncbi:MAG: quinate 5-dehydrogenase [Chloroflexota bacterium]|nr:quinate 5-dehydrogenase [Chloroflexota bacterium]